MKYLFWIGLFFAIYWFLRNKKIRNSSNSSTPETRRPREPEQMVTCAHCGVHLPISESITAKGLHFCSTNHQQAANPDNT